MTLSDKVRIGLKRRRWALLAQWWLSFSGVLVEVPLVNLVQLEGALPSVCFRADICMVNRSSDFLVVVGGMWLHLR